MNEDLDLRELEQTASGDCYFAAWSFAHQLAFQVGDDQVRIVHGWVEGRGEIQGIRFVHAWEEAKLRRDRPNDFTKRTGDAGTGNVCANSVAGVAVKTIGWEPSCECHSQDGKGVPVSRGNEGEQEWRWIAPDPIPATVFDPFGGSGTTAAVARALGRHAVLCELNPEYVDLVPGRVEAVLASYYGRAKLDRVEPLENQMSLF